VAAHGGEDAVGPGLERQVQVRREAVRRVGHALQQPGSTVVISMELMRIRSMPGRVFSRSTTSTSVFPSQA
jgi:hypothetical protein